MATELEVNVPISRSIEQMERQSVSAAESLEAVIAVAFEDGGIFCWSNFDRCEAFGNPISSARAMTRRRPSQSLLDCDRTSCLWVEVSVTLRLLIISEDIQSNTQHDSLNAFHRTRKAVISDDQFINVVAH